MQNKKHISVQAWLSVDELLSGSESIALLKAGKCHTEPGAKARIEHGQLVRRALLRLGSEGVFRVESRENALSVEPPAEGFHDSLLMNITLARIVTFGMMHSEAKKVYRETAATTELLNSVKSSRFVDFRDNLHDYADIKLESPVLYKRKVIYPMLYTEEKSLIPLSIPLYEPKPGSALPSTPLNTMNPLIRLGTLSFS